MCSGPGQEQNKNVLSGSWSPTKPIYNTLDMKKSIITMMAAALMGVSAYAGEATTDSFTTPSQDFKRLSGAVHLGAATAYTLHGYVPTTEVVQGEGVGYGAIQIAYDFGKESFWSYVGAVSYKIPMSGHTLYGNPNILSREGFVSNAGISLPSPNSAAWYAPSIPVGYDPSVGVIKMSAEDIYQSKKYHPMGAKNIENEFIFRNGLKYTRELWNTSFGYDFIHGGIPGVIAKHFDGERQSRMHQVWINGEITPVAWFSADVNIARTFDTIDGWWLEAHARFKAPIIGSPEDITLAGILEFGLSATHQFYDESHNACDNGLQAYWVKLSTPWFMNDAKSFILTPSVSFNWLGRGGRQANTRSHARAYGDSYVPFRNFAVVGDMTLTYKF